MRSLKVNVNSTTNYSNWTAHSTHRFANLLKDDDINDKQAFFPIEFLIPVVLVASAAHQTIIKFLILKSVCFRLHVEVVMVA